MAANAAASVVWLTGATTPDANFVSVFAALAVLPTPVFASVFFATGVFTDTGAALAVPLDTGLAAVLAAAFVIPLDWVALVFVKAFPGDFAVFPAVTALVFAGAGFAVVFFTAGFAAVLLAAGLTFFAAAAFAGFFIEFAMESTYKIRGYFSDAVQDVWLRHPVIFCSAAVLTALRS
jgi:hypothetical protein